MQVENIKMNYDSLGKAKTKFGSAFGIHQSLIGQNKRLQYVEIYEIQREPEEVKLKVPQQLVEAFETACTSVGLQVKPTQKQNQLMIIIHKNVTGTVEKS